jgi:hypothetical protein
MQSKCATTDKLHLNRRDNSTVRRHYAFTGKQINAEEAEILDDINIQRRSKPRHSVTQLTARTKFRKNIHQEAMLEIKENTISTPVSRRQMSQIAGQKARTESRNGKDKPLNRVSWNFLPAKMEHQCRIHLGVYPQIHVTAGYYLQLIISPFRKKLYRKQLVQQLACYLLVTSYNIWFGSCM